MKIILLIVLTSSGMDSQEFFDPSACERALHEIKEQRAALPRRARNVDFLAFCTPKRLVKP